MISRSILLTACSAGFLAMACSSQALSQSNVDQTTQQPLLNPDAQQPLLNPDDQQPVFNPDGQQPVFNPDGEQPVFNPDGQQPVFDPNGQQPVLDPNGQQPPLDPSGQQPVFNPDGQQPPLNPDGQQPVFNPDGQQPPLDPSGQQPPLDSGGQEAHTPPSNNPVFYPTSYSCQGRLNRTEFTICTTHELALMDVKMAGLYHKARRRIGKRVRRDQRVFLKRRNACRDSVDCLRWRYQERVAALQTALGQRVDGDGRVYSESARYRCQNGKTLFVEYKGDGSKDIAVLSDGQSPSRTFTQTVSGSGSLYALGDMEWHVKGSDGILSRGSSSLACSQQ